MVVPRPPTDPSPTKAGSSRKHRQHPPRRTNPIPLTYTPSSPRGSPISADIPTLQSILALPINDTGDEDSDTSSLATPPPHSKTAPLHVRTQTSPYNFAQSFPNPFTQSPFITGSAPASTTQSNAPRIVHHRDVTLVTTLPNYGLGESSDDDSDFEDPVTALPVPSDPLPSNPAAAPIVPKLNLPEPTPHSPTHSPELATLILKIAARSQLEFSTSFSKSLTARVLPVTTPPAPVALPLTARRDFGAAPITDVIDWSVTRSELISLSARVPTSPITAPPPANPRPPPRGTPPFCNIAKFNALHQQHAGTDWYVFNDGSPYVSKWEEYRKKEKGDPRLMITQTPFNRMSGKRSEWKLPDKHGVRCSGPYTGHEEEAALVERGATWQREEKWVDKKGWISHGDRNKPHYRRRIARGFKGYHDDGSIRVPGKGANAVRSKEESMDADLTHGMFSERGVDTHLYI